MKLKQFIHPTQLKVIQQLSKGEEGDFFLDKLIELEDIINTMPKTYETDEQGDDAIVYLHYFYGSCDWWVIEREKIDDEQAQAFGFVNMGDVQNAELGYISIEELLSMDVTIEIDLYWTPKTLGEVKQSIGRRAA